MDGGNAVVSTPKQPERRLTVKAALSCENAKPGTRCRCRCGGAAHGRGLISDRCFTAEAAWRLESDLPPEDPHYRPVKRKRWKPKQLPLFEKGNAT